MAYKIKIPSKPILMSDGRIKCEIQIFRDGKLIERWVESRRYPKATDEGCDTPRKRLEAFTAGLASLAESLTESARDLSERKTLADAEMTDAELSKLEGFEYEAR